MVTIQNKEIAQPIHLHPSNPHYFQYNEDPIILITSAEHYGAIVNGEFDYVTNLNTLKSYGLNYTRIYPGFLFEPENKFIEGNTLGPKPKSIVLPWARSEVPGYVLDGNLFDLDHWNAQYFERLRDFVTKAEERGIIVEVCFFNAQYSDTWPISPLNFKNNVQGVGNCDYKDAQTMKYPDLVKREEEYVRKITKEVNQFSNIILEICDEPIITGTPLSLAGPWVRHFVKVIKNQERELPKKHLIAQQVEGPLSGPCDLSNHPDVSVIVSQYVWEASGEQMGGMKALDFEYEHNKPIELNETFYYPVWYRGDQIVASRVEAWEFIVGGGASFNHLNGRFTVSNPAGDTDDNAQILKALKNLKEFMSKFNFIKMHPDTNFVVHGISLDAHYRGISEPGELYALYIHHSVRGKDGPSSEQAVYVVVQGKYNETLVLNLPFGHYQVEWINPASNTIIRTEKIIHKKENEAIKTPTYSVDIALRIKRIA